jgi:tetratricopeptide (TPR) repeat protein
MSYPAVHLFLQRARQVRPGISLVVLRETGNFARATAMFDECLELHRALGDRDGIAAALLGFSDVARDHGDIARTRAYCEQSLAIARDRGVQWVIGFALNNLALAACANREMDAALNRVGESIAVFRATQADASRAEVLITRGQILRVLGDAPGALESLIEALRIARTLGPRVLVAMALEGLAALLVGQGQAAQSVQFNAAAAALRVQMGTPIRACDRTEVAMACARANDGLGKSAFGAAWRSGEERMLDQMLDAAFALDLLSGHQLMTDTT